jgi:hypothetical protein
VQTADNGAQFRVVVTNGLGAATSNAATLTVTANQPPTAAITQPPSGTLYSAGESIAYAGTGSDPEDGTLPPSSFTWRVDFHHEDHTHPFAPDTSGSASGSFTPPKTGETSSDVWYRVYLTVRDGGGLTSTAYRDVLPRKAGVTLATNVPGLQLLLDGQPKAAPHSFTGVVGVTRTLEAPSPQTVAGTTYEFVSWSDGGARQHTIDTPASATTFTATFREIVGAPPPLPTQGLVAHWAFDETGGTTAADGSGNGRAGTLVYGPTWGSVLQCRIGGCVSLDGVDDYVRVLDAAALKLTGDVSISSWIRPASVGRRQSIVSKRYEFELGWIHDVSPFGLKWSHKESGGGLVSGDLTTSTEAGQWQHVVLVRDAATKQMRGYKNGVPALTSSYLLAPGTSTYNVNIGRNPGGAQHFGGLLDEVRIYARALTDAEVQALFGQG